MASTADRIPSDGYAPLGDVPTLAVVDHLHKYFVPLETFLASNPQYQAVVVSACIVVAKTLISTDAPNLPQEPHLLLVQRAATERGFPNCWEVPGGSVNHEDIDIIRGLVREVKEETGLTVKEVFGEIEPAIEFTTGRGMRMKRWLKLSFVVKVDMQHTSLDGFPIVTLNPEEHQDHQWLNRQEVELRERRLTGGLPPVKRGDGLTLALVSAEQQQVMLKALST